MTPAVDPHAALALRIDVDFAPGLQRAVPIMLDRLAEAGMHATFFVVAGSNRPWRSLRRLLQPGYARRLRALGATRIAGGFGGALWRGGGLLDSAAARHAVRRILDEGHELAVHGYDHAWWAERAWCSTPDRLAHEIDRAFTAMRGISGPLQLAWGSPNWRSTEAVLAQLHRRGVPYFSDCWGSGPFVTLDPASGVIPVPHLPITLPSLESLALAESFDAVGAVERLLDARAGDTVDVICCHDYFEGLLRPELFERLLTGCRRRGWRTVALRDAARRLVADVPRLPRCRLTRAGLPGFVGEVSWQASAVSPGSA